MRCSWTEFLNYGMFVFCSLDFIWLFRWLILDTFFPAFLGWVFDFVFKTMSKFLLQTFTEKTRVGIRDKSNRKSFSFSWCVEVKILWIFPHLFQDGCNWRWIEIKANRKFPCDFLKVSKYLTCILQLFFDKKIIRLIFHLCHSLQDLNLILIWS